MAWIVAQLAPQPIAVQLLPTVKMDAQQEQPSTSTANLDKHGQWICKPARYEHSMKQKTQQQEEVESCKVHKARMIDEPHVPCTPQPSTSPTEHGKMLSQCTRKCCEQQAKQKERQSAGQASSTTGTTAQLKVTPTKHSSRHTKTTQSSVPLQQTPPA
uniref:Uncharacterized protein n=1 Tax=Romanomermis culicivorax TaxID=13658 RepID=A0A915INR7_ROMCU